MRLLKPFLDLAQEAGLQSALESDPMAPTFSVPAGDYGLIISGMRGVPADEADARVSLAFGLSRASLDDIASLAMLYDYSMEVWKLEYDLKGDDPPPEIRALAERFELTDLEGSVAFVDDGKPAEVVKAMIEFVIAQRKLLEQRPIPSKIPVADFIAGGGRFPT